MGTISLVPHPLTSHLCFGQSLPGTVELWESPRSTSLLLEICAFCSGRSLGATDYETRSVLTQ